MILNGRAYMNKEKAGREIAQATFDRNPQDRQMPVGIVSLGAGLLLGGTACAVFGYWLNVARPRQQAGGYVEDLRQDLWQRVRAGSFQVEPGAAAPRDEAEATQQVEQIVARQRPTIERRLRNRNSLFFIPLQWLGGAVALGGVVLALMGLLGTTP